jgi:hypothetical protein
VHAVTSLMPWPLMQIRTQIAKEMTEDLKNVSEENALLLRESLSVSLSKMLLVDDSADGPNPPGDAAP